MKMYKHRDGDRRIWISKDQMEDRMESELVKANLMPSLDNSVVDVRTFVEGYLKADFDDYAELDAKTLGETEFRVGRRPKVSINRDLTSAAMDDDESPPGLVGRWRATVAHEATHVIFHECLYDLRDDSGSLFDEVDPGDGPEQPPPQRLLRCDKVGVLFRGGSSDWREIQANMGMGCLLMPKSLFVAAIVEEMKKLGVDRIDRGSTTLTTLVSVLAGQFQVSKQAARIRLENLEVVTDKRQTLIL